MSEHRTNTRAQLKDTLPPLLPHGCQVGVALGIEVMPRNNVMVLPAEKMRTTEAGIEVLVGEPEEWHKLPEGMLVHELGKPLPPEKCDAVAILGAVVEDTLGPKLLQAGQQRPQGRVSTGPMAVLARVPLDKWQEAHLGALRGPVE